MTTTLITRDLGYFAASHNLPDHDGGCKSLHGHNYRVIVTIGGTISCAQGVPYSGMIVDFTHIKNIWKAIHDKVDHGHIIANGKWPQWYSRFVELAPGGQAEVDALLGKVAHLDIADSTAEHLSGWILREMQAGLTAFLLERGVEGYTDGAVPYIHSVAVYETESSWATAYAG